MPPDPQLDAIEEIAAAWMVERDRGFSPVREREFSRWLAADPRHAAAFEALAATWELLGESRTADGVGTERESPLVRRRPAWVVPALAAAAAVAIVAVAGWRGPMAERHRAERFTLSAATDVGGLRKVELPDGSVIQLNTDSAVDVHFQPEVRRVRLMRGEAYFTVAKNSARPFVVSAGGVDVRVVGTVFNVRLRSESVDVLVTEGKVRVGSPPPETTVAPPAPDGSAALSELTAGQKVSIARAAAAELQPPPTAPRRVTPAEIRQTLAWQVHRLDFDGTPLGEIVTEINRYNRHKLVILDEPLKAQRFGGSFPASDYQTFVRMLEADFGVVAERTRDETRLRAKR